MVSTLEAQDQPARDEFQAAAAGHTKACLVVQREPSGQPMERRQTLLAPKKEQ